MDVELDKAMEILEKIFIRGTNRSSELVKETIKDSCKRLLFPSMETEMRQWAKEKADREAIRVFAENLRQLLLAPPLGQKNVLAIDPGFRTGCKVVCLDRQGKLLHNETISPPGRPPTRSFARSAAPITPVTAAFAGVAGRSSRPDAGSPGL